MISDTMDTSLGFDHKLVMDQSAQKLEALSVISNKV